MKIQAQAPLDMYNIRCSDEVLADDDENVILLAINRYWL